MAISRSQMTRQLYQGGGVSSLKQARDVLEAQALPGEFLAYINPEEAKFLRYMGGAGIPINSSGIPSYFGGIGKAFKSAVKGVTGAVKGAVKGVTDFAKSDIGQIALAIAAPYALGPAFGAIGLSGSVGGSAFLGNALRAGITNLALQGVTTGRFDLGRAAKAGVIGGGIQTGLNKFTKVGEFDPYKDSVPPDAVTGDVTKGSEVLYDADTFTPTPSMEGFTQAPATDTFAGQTIGPIQSTEQSVMGLDYGGPEYTASTLPETGTDTMKLFSSEAAAAENLTKTGTASTFDFDPSEPIGGAVGMESIQGKFGQTVGTRFTDPITGATSVVKGGVSDIPLADRAGQFSTEIKDVFREGATVSERATSAVNALKQISGAALDRPMSSIAIASLLSAASVPQQPDESDFDYEERMKIVNDYASYYGERAGVDMSEAGSIDDYESYYSERARVAMGGSPEVPTGNVRENQAGIMELDYRDTGGRVPIGIKERADDVPAMLSKDEFVFTSKAVKNAGNGDVDKGAEKLYKVMNILENGGTV